MSNFLVVGVTGQDGSLLAEELLVRGHSVIGTHRSFSPSSFWRLEKMNIANRIEFIDYEVGSPINLQLAIEKYRPDAVFFTAGYSATASAALSPARLMNINAVGCAEQIEVLRNTAPETKAVFFSSSEVFGYQEEPGRVVDETSSRKPSNPYGVSKLALSELVEFYRVREGLPLYEAILFPHESPYRASNFFVRKVVRSLCERNQNPEKHQVTDFGSLDSTRDWGSAKQYMKWLVEIVIRGFPPDSYLVGTGIAHSGWDVFQFAAEALGERVEILESEDSLELYISGNMMPVARAGIRSLPNAGHGAVANMSLLRSQGISEPFIKLEHVIREMVISELQRFPG